MKNYKALIFDWDGTLVDTCGLILDAHNHVRDAFGKKRWTMDDFMGQASQSAREYYPKIYGDRADEAQEVLYEYVEKYHLEYLEPIEGTRELLDSLKALNIPLGVVSNKRDRTLKIEIDHLEFGGYFDFIIGAGVAKADKPSPDPLLDAMKALNSDFVPTDILYVGDTETDLLTAQNAKIDCVFIQSDKPRPDLVKKYTPQYQFLYFSEFSAAYHADLDDKTVING